MKVQAEILTGAGKDAHNSIEAPENVAPYVKELDRADIVLPPLSFAVLRVENVAALCSC